MAQRTLPRGLSVRAPKSYQEQIKNIQDESDPFWVAFLTGIRGAERSTVQILELLLDAAFDFIDRADEQSCEYYPLNDNDRMRIQRMFKERDFPVPTVYDEQKVHHVLFTVYKFAECVFLLNAHACGDKKDRIARALHVYTQQDERADNVERILEALGCDSHPGI